MSREQNANPFIPNREELAWAGGFYSGEGCTRVHVTKHNKRLIKKHYNRANMSLVQCTEDGSVPEPLKRFWDAIGNLGNITGPYPKRHQRGKDYYTWSASKFVESQAIIAMLWPWLSEAKKEQAQKTLLAAGAPA